MASPAWTSDRTIRLVPREQTPVAARALAARVSAANLPGVADCVPSARSVLVVVDPMAVGNATLGSLPSRLSTLVDAPDDDGAGPSDAPRTITIRACYDRRCAPDLEAAADGLGLTPGDLVERHASGVYTVECVGFSPGFAYLAGLDRALHLRRKASPVPRVPPGSVGIAGDTTGVYPHATPGGWHLIGRTAERLFDVNADRPARLRAGDTVRFEEVSFDAFLDAGGADV